MALEQRLLDAREAPARAAHDEVVVDIGLGAKRAATVELLQQRDKAIRELGADITRGCDRVAIAGCRQGPYADAEPGDGVRVLSVPSPAVRGLGPKTGERRWPTPSRTRRSPRDVLEAVTEAMIVLHARYHGREPVSARTRMMGEDTLAVMLGDPYTDVEKR